MSDSRATIGLDARKAGDFGIGTYTRELVAALAANPGAAGYRFVLFVRPKDRERFAGLPENFTLQIADFPGYSLSELTTFAGLVRRRRLSLFHALHYILPPWLGTPSVVTVHDLIHLHPELSPKPWAYPYAHLMLRSAVSRASGVITVSESTRRELANRFPLAAGKISVIRHGVASEFRPDAASAARVSKKYGLPERYALFLGGERPHKNLARILEAFDIASRSGLDLGLVLAGPLPNRSWWERFVSSRRPATPARILGVVPQEDLQALYPGALLFLYPTLAEGFGLPALESMASGTPVIASDIPVWRETCGGAAVLVDPRDSRAIAEAIARLASSPEERGRLRVLGLKHAATFSWDVAAAKTLRVYEQAL